jgi:hypothetical protein
MLRRYAMGIYVDRTVLARLHLSDVNGGKQQQILRCAQDDKTSLRMTSDRFRSNNPCILVADFFADLYVQAFDLLVESGQGDVELFGGVGLVPVVAL